METQTSPRYAAYHAVTNFPALAREKAYQLLRVGSRSHRTRRTHGSSGVTTEHAFLSPASSSASLSTQKRLFDIFFSGIALVLLAPAFLVIGATIKLTSPGPILFSQLRYGRNRKLFRLYKFRTMYLDENEGSPSSRVIQATPNDLRLTPIGAFLRRTSLDELPQFWNVLSGDMSVVGPRPHAPRTMIGNHSYEDAVTDFERRHEARPGITGAAQANGLNGPISDLAAARMRFQLDVRYVETKTLWQDVKIIAVTVRNQFFSRSSF